MSFFALHCLATNHVKQETSLPDTSEVDQVPVRGLCQEAYVNWLPVERHRNLLIEEAYLCFDLHSDRLPSFHVLSG